MVKTARAQRARSRELVSQIDRDVAAFDAQRSDRITRDRLIKAAKRDIRRELRALESARRARRAAEVRAGDGIRRLLNEGLTTSELAMWLGLSRNVIKRLLSVAATATDARYRSSSTEGTANRTKCGVPPHSQLNDAAPGGSKEGRL